MNIHAWQSLMDSFGFGANQSTFDALCAAYSEKHRHYHTTEHLDACVSHLHTCASQADRPREIELALWFHDAIYRPLSSDNERRSADWAGDFLQANCAPEPLARRIDALIMVTEHDSPATTPDQSLLVDIDLSILGAPPATYARFEEAVRREYRLVPWLIYRRKRAAILDGFLQRPRIYRNEPFRTQREQQARNNLADTISRLGGTPAG